MSNSAKHNPARIAHARFAVLAIFFINGALFASWVPHIPFVQERHELGEGALGFALLCPALGGLVAMSLTGWLIHCMGSRAVTSVATLLFCLVLPMPILAPTFLWLMIALLGLGVANGAMDVAMNTQGVAVEQGYGRPVLSSMHGFFSIGGLVGAGLGSLALAVEVTPLEHVTAIALVLTVVGLGAALWLLPSHKNDDQPGPVFARPSGLLLRLGLLAFICLLAEGAIADWSAVYLRFNMGAESAVAAAGFAGFSLLMAIGRFTGDRLTAILGSVELLRIGSLLASLGLVLAVAAAEPWLVILGFSLVGLGVANTVPILFRAAGQAPGFAPGNGIAAVATLGYCGWLGGPPMIGLIAEVTTLAFALALVAGLLGAMATFAAVVRPAN